LDHLIQNIKTSNHLSISTSPTPADADLVIIKTEWFDTYFSVSIPLNGEASVYNTSIGPQCDSALMLDSSSGFYDGNGANAANADGDDPFYEKVGSRVAEMQPPSKVNAWPVVLEMANYPIEDYSVVSLRTGGSDVVQQCGFGRASNAKVPNNFYFGAGDIGQYLSINRLTYERWYNDTESPTTSPTTDPTTDPTAPTETPTMAPTLPTRQPTQEPTQEPTTMEPTVVGAVEKGDDGSDNGLAIGLGVAGGVVALLILGGVVYYFLVVKKQ